VEDVAGHFWHTLNAEERRMIRMLVSVKNLPEARHAAAVGVDYLDLKDPADGALGALPETRIAAIVAELRPRYPHLVISATIGDLPVNLGSAIVQKVHTVANLGVDLVKVGVPGRGGAHVEKLLQALARSEQPIVPVLLADHGVDRAFFTAVCGLPFAALMLDTEHKRAGSLLEHTAPEAIAALALTARQAGKPFGLAGALRFDDVPGLLRLRPDFAGFRSAVCAQSRSGRLIPERVRRLREALQGELSTAAPGAALQAGRRPAA
jgi:(5-formylfuran-3-yl)methyl phosphate synthase